MKETKILLTLHVKLKKDFKVTCAKNDLSMSQTIRWLMREYIKQYEK